jgi:hypothetical protein
VPAGEVEAFEEPVDLVGHDWGGGRSVGDTRTSTGVAHLARQQLCRTTGIVTQYLRGTPLGPLRAEASVDRIEGVKTFARGRLIDADGVTVEAEGVFITPAWARDAG